MWAYDKKLEYPVKIKNPSAALARVIISQLGGPDGEMGAATRYLSQRYAMPTNKAKGLLTDIGTEELAHMEMVSAIVYQLTKDLTPQQIADSGLATYFVDHTTERDAVFGGDTAIDGRPDHRPERGSCSRAEGADDV